MPIAQTPTQDIPTALVAFGTFLLVGLAADAVGRRTFLPRVTLLLGCGIVASDSALGLIPAVVAAQFETIANLALMMIGFLLGGKLSVRSLRADGPVLLSVSLAAALTTAALVGVSLLALGVAAELAILLGCIAAATAPAATVDTVLESGTENRFSRLLLGIVAIDDAWALLLFSVGLATTALLNGTAIEAPLSSAAREIGGAIALGAALGLPAAYLTGRVRPGQPMLTEALALVLVCGGLAMWLDVSYLIATMTMGAMITNLARHHDYPFHEIENVEWPFLVVFFILAGASLELDVLTSLGVAGAAYLLARSAGKVGGAWLGASAAGAPPDVRRYMGLALLPQAGVAIGMALLASNEFPEYRQTILPLAIGTTIVFELLGPVATRFALRRANL